MSSIGLLLFGINNTYMNAFDIFKCGIMVFLLIRQTCAFCNKIIKFYFLTNQISLSLNVDLSKLKLKQRNYGCY